MQNCGFTPIDEWNFAELNSDDQHAKYFQITTKVFELPKKVHALSQKQDDFEFETISNFLNLLTTSVKALNLKYAYPTSRRIWLDLSESGFPNQLELAALEKDIATSKDRILELE